MISSPSRLRAGAIIFFVLLNTRSHSADIAGIASLSRAAWYGVGKVPRLFHHQSTVLGSPAVGAWLQYSSNSSDDWLVAVGWRKAVSIFWGLFCLAIAGWLIVAHCDGMMRRWRGGWSKSKPRKSLFAQLERQLAILTTPLLLSSQSCSSLASTTSD